MRHGMAAWMHRVADLARRAAPPGPARRAAALPADVHQPVIDILTTMIFAVTREALT